MEKTFSFVHNSASVCKLFIPLPGWWASVFINTSCLSTVKHYFVSPDYCARGANVVALPSTCNAGTKTLILTFHMVTSFFVCRDKCLGSQCHSPSVGFGVCCLDKNFNLDNNFQIRRGRALILHICIPCEKKILIFLYLQWWILVCEFGII